VSIGELRAAVDAVAGLAVEARTHVALAAEHLRDAAGTLADLAERSGEELPFAELARAREEVDGVLVLLRATAELVTDLGARL